MFLCSFTKDVKQGLLIRDTCFVSRVLLIEAYFSKHQSLVTEFGNLIESIFVLVSIPGKDPKSRKEILGLLTILYYILLCWNVNRHDKSYDLIVMYVVNSLLTPFLSHCILWFLPGFVQMKMSINIHSYQPIHITKKSHINWLI